MSTEPDVVADDDTEQPPLDVEAEVNRLLGIETDGARLT